MHAPLDIIRQHLIDPELCTRCNSCMETCSSNAISTNFRNLAVDVEKCNACYDCVKPCPTGAINIWRPVERVRAHSIEEQLEWDELPAETLSADVLAGFSQEDFLPPAAHPEIEPVFTHKSPGTAILRSNAKIAGAGPFQAIHHVVLDLSATPFVFREGQSLGILPPGLDYHGKPHLMRLYSIASTRSGEGGQAGHVALTVKRVLEDYHGNPVRGVCSNFLCDLNAGDEVAVAGPFGADFVMPEDLSRPLLMIATGTGIAPMRAMIKRRLSAGETPGRMLLVYGGRTPEDLAHSAELQELAGTALDVVFAHSRVPGAPKRYVQDALRDVSAKVAEITKAPNGHIFMCGLKGMEQGVFNALESICADQGQDWASLRGQLSEQDRLHIETY